MLSANITAMGFNQHVRFPKHSCGHTLDILITENHNDLKVLICSARKFISDHCAVEFTMKVKKENILSETKTFRSMKHLHLKLLISLFINIQLDNLEQIDDMVKVFENRANQILDQYAPEVTRTVIHRKLEVWFNDTINEMKQRLFKREQLWRKYCESHQWTAFKKVLNKYVYEINKAKNGTMTDLVLNSKGTLNKLYTLGSGV